MKKNKIMNINKSIMANGLMEFAALTEINQKRKF